MKTLKAVAARYNATSLILRIVIDLHAKARTRYILTRGKKRLDIRLDKTK
mgnify:CR=1 FL=1